jgi:hypothetical protein
MPDEPRAVGAIPPASLELPGGPSGPTSVPEKKPFGVAGTSRVLGAVYAQGREKLTERLPSPEGSLPAGQQSLAEGIPGLLFELCRDEVKRIVQVMVWSRVRRKAGDTSSIANQIFLDYLKYVKNKTDLTETDIERHWGLLFNVSIRRCMKVMRWWERKGDREKSLDRTINFIKANPKCAPEVASIASDLLERIDRGMEKRDERRGDVAKLIMEGHTQVEIAWLLKCSAATVRRDLNDMKDLLAEG